MKKIYFILFLLFFCFGVIFLFSNIFLSEFSSVENGFEKCPTSSFSKGSIVFDSVVVCATSMVSDDKVIYASNVIALWLDNDYDGKVDDVLVLENLKKNNATIIMSLDGFSYFFLLKLFSESSNMGLNIQDLSAYETNNKSRRDASQEETHHLILAYGWASAYPDIFGFKKLSDSVLYNLWENAESNNFYNYDDPTCDDECRVVEYFYKVNAAYLGSSADLFDDEFTLKDRVSLLENQPEFDELFNSINYNYSRFFWPDGNYKFEENILYVGLNNLD